MPSFAFHPRFAGYATQFSPFQPNVLVACASENFGIAGSGKVYVLEFSAREVTLRACFATQDSAFDVAWSEANPNHVAVACGDGAVRVWDCGSPQSAPVQVYREAGDQEVYCVQWNLVAKETFITASWDKACRLWDPHRPTPVQTYTGHGKEVYEASWSPVRADVFASVSGDGCFKVWDTRRPQSLLTKQASAMLLSCDWNKYDDNVLVTAAAESVVLWDLRSLRQPRAVLRGHQSAVRRTRCSPHHRNLIASAAYDFSLIVWDTDRPSPMAQRYVQHTEFVSGVDWHLREPKVLASCSWDGTLYLLQVGQPPQPTHPAQPPLPLIEPPAVPPSRPHHPTALFGGHAG